MPVGKQKTVFYGEAMSIYMALGKLVPRDLYNKKIILSDSKDVIQAIGSREIPP